MEKLGLSEKIICNLVGKMFSLVTKNESWYELDTIYNWLRSDTLKRLEEQDETLICQSKVYLYHDFQNECSNLQSHNGYHMNEPALTWFGYLSMYWIYLREISGDDILKKYNLEEVLNQFDTLHTMSIKSAILL